MDDNEELLQQITDYNYWPTTTPAASWAWLAGAWNEPMLWKPLF
jgi:hypothetical protein